MSLYNVPILLKRILLVVFITLSCKAASAQIGIYDTLQIRAIVYEGDTIILSTLSNIYVYAQLTDAQKRAIAAYNRLRNAVYVTYPFARKSGILMNDINDKLRSINDNTLRKRYINSREKELKKEFTTPLTNLSVYQGKILMKLINRETGDNCYEIIKEYKSGLTARIYQTVAFFFDTNLKQSYNSNDEDRAIERIVQEVQRLYGYTEISKHSSL